MKKSIVAFTMTMGILLFVSVTVGHAEVVPNVVGMSVYNAAMALGKVKLRSNLQTVVTANQIDNNRVFKQNPAAGTTVNPGTQVQLFAYRYQPGQQPAAVNQSPPYRIVPQITNTRADQAQSVLLRQGFKASISYVDTPDQRRNGYVYRQSPPAGQKVAPGATVTLAVYRFKTSTVQVPQVTSAKADQAQAMLTRAGFQVGIGYVDTPDRSRDGIVARQSPPAGQKVASGSRVMLQVYRFASTPVAVPAVTNAPVESGRSALMAKGFTVSITYVDTPDQRLNGIIASQNPLAGQKPSPGSVVRLQVYRYRTVQVQVPKVTGVSREQAISILQSKGLKVRWGKSVPSSDQRRKGIIAIQSPNPGQEVASGTEVRLDWYQEIQDMSSGHKNIQPQTGPRFLGEVKTPPRQ